MQQSCLTALAPGRRPAIKLASRVPTVSVQAVRPSSENGGMGPPEASPVLLLAIKTVLVASAVSAVAAQPAFARGWHERRHHRRMQDQYATPQQEVAAPQPVVAQAAPKPAAPSALRDLQRGMRRMYRKARRAIQGDAVYVEHISSRDVAVPSSSSSPELQLLGWFAVLVAVGGGLFIMLGNKVSWPLWGRRRRNGEEGRWVYDRSLGGKMVFVPDAPKAPRSVWGDDVLPPATSTVTAPTYPDAAAGSSLANGGELRRAVVPEWWVPPSTAAYCTPGRQEDLQKESKSILRELEDAKLQGMDYPLSALRALRTVCQEGGGLQVKPRTENGRDAMLRTAVRAAMECAMEGNRQLLGGDEPCRFVCGLAHDLGVPDPRAVTITHAEVAACARALLIGAEAAYRGNDETEVMLSLLKLAQLLAAFPLPPGSAEAELLAGSIQQQTSMEFRRFVFFTVGAYIDATRAPLLAEMLGFDPALVMPQLLLQLQAADRAQQLQREQSQAS